MESALEGVTSDQNVLIGTCIIDSIIDSISDSAILLGMNNTAIESIPSPVAKCQECDETEHLLVISMCKNCIQKKLKPKPDIKCYLCHETKSAKKCIKIDKSKKGILLGICGACIRDELLELIALKKY